MKTVLIGFLAVVLVLGAGATWASEIWPKIWGNCETFVDRGNPYDATDYIYNPVDSQWVCGTETGVGYFTVTADIEMYLSMHFDYTDIYFHIADDRESMKAIVKGWLCSNSGQWLFVSSELNTKDIENLVFEYDIFGRDAAWHIAEGLAVPAIPVKWQLSEEGGAWKDPQMSKEGNTGQLWGFTWLLADGKPCCHNFRIKVVITPARHQPDGRYQMDPAIGVAPVL